MRLHSTLQHARLVLGELLSPGDIAVDGTVGNGHDTLFLARCVGAAGHVYGFDIQEQALANTAARLEENECAEQVTLFAAGHEELDRYIPSHVHGTVRAAMFNFGFLPGSDQEVITRPDTSLAAVGKVLDILAPDGCASLMLYGGHPGGEEETAALKALVRGLDYDRFRVLEYEFVNKPVNPVALALIQKVSKFRVDL